MIKATFERLWSKSPVTGWFLVVWVAMEAFVFLLGPVLVRGTDQLARYMGDTGKTNLERFYSGKTRAMLFDSVTGWRNTPGFEHRKWKIDTHGARSTAGFEMAKGEKKRVMFLGSSLVNGGEAVRNDQTMSAFVEDEIWEALNFGTMLFTIDQCLLAYVDRLHEYSPDVVVVGLSGNPTEGLTNRFIPLRMQSETSMPFFKPRFRIVGGDLESLGVPTPSSALELFEGSGILEELSSTDGYYSNFQLFRRCGFTPLTSSLHRFGKRGFNLIRLLSPETEDQDLLIRLMDRFRSEVTSRSGEIIFVVLPDQQKLEGGWRELLPDKYGNLVELMRHEEFEVLDGREILSAAGAPPSELYHRDRQHYTARGNEILGQAVRRWLGP